MKPQSEGLREAQLRSVNPSLFSSEILFSIFLEKRILDNVLFTRCQAFSTRLFKLLKAKALTTLSLFV